jgi:hypothetical protein
MKAFKQHSSEWPGPAMRRSGAGCFLRMSTPANHDWPSSSADTRLSPPPPGEHPPDSLVRPQLQRGPQCEGSELSTQPAFWAFPRAVFEFPGLPAPFPSRDNALNGVTSCTWRLGLRILDCEAVQPQSCLSKRSSSTKQPTGGTDTDAIRLPANHRRLLGSDSLQARSPRPFLLSARDAKII